MKLLIGILLPTILLLGCKDNDKPFDSVAPKSVTGSKTTNNTGTTIVALAEGSVATVPGSYSLTYEKTSLPTLAAEQTYAAQGWNAGIDAAQYVAQTFKPSATGEIQELKVMVSGSMGAATAVVTLYQGEPGSLSQLASGSVAVDTTKQLRVVNFSSSVPLVKDAVYTLVVSSDGDSLVWYMDDRGNTYANGQGYVSSNSGASWGLSTYDYAFSVSVNVATWTYAYNSAQQSFSSFPANQTVNIDGGVAGVLSFTVDASAPSSSPQTDAVSVVVSE